MAIDKNRYEDDEADLLDGGMGFASEEDPYAELDIEIEPESVTFEDGSMEITLLPGDDEGDEIAFDDNLAESLDEKELQLLGGDSVSYTHLRAHET